MAASGYSYERDDDIDYVEVVHLIFDVNSTTTNCKYLPNYPLGSMGKSLLSYYYFGTFFNCAWIGCILKSI